jgi:outer membrane protein OmpA-like peptidoglycan-associated protein
VSSKSPSVALFGGIIVWSSLVLAASGAEPAGWGGGPTSFASSAQPVSARSTGFDAKEDALNIVIDLSADVLFDFDRSDLRPEAEQNLQQVAQMIASRGSHQVRIDGYTDARGSVTHNQKLSLARAEAVHHWLVQHGDLRTVLFAEQGLGANNPVAPNSTADGRDDPAGRQKNRRVEITIRNP